MTNWQKIAEDLAIEKAIRAYCSSQGSGEWYDKALELYRKNNSPTSLCPIMKSSMEAAIKAYQEAVKNGESDAS